MVIEIIFENAEPSQDIYKTIHRFAPSTVFTLAVVYRRLKNCARPRSAGHSHRLVSIPGPVLRLKPQIVILPANSGGVPCHADVRRPLSQYWLALPCQFPGTSLQ